MGKEKGILLGRLMAILPEDNEYRRMLECVHGRFGDLMLEDWLREKILEGRMDKAEVRRIITCNRGVSKPHLSKIKEDYFKPGSFRKRGDFKCRL